MGRHPRRQPHRRDAGHPGGGAADAEPRWLGDQHRVDLRSRGGSRIRGLLRQQGWAHRATKVAALELAGDGIRVNVIVPGGVSTPMNEHEKEGGVIPDTPLRRRAHPSEISGAVVFLASEDASFVTGSELVVDGGYLAR